MVPERVTHKKPEVGFLCIVLAVVTSYICNIPRTFETRTRDMSVQAFFVRNPSHYVLMKCGTRQFWRFENEFQHFENEFHPF